MAYIGRTPTGSILTGADIADGSISTAKIADTAISTAKIADDAVGNTKLNLASDYAFTGTVSGAGSLTHITTQTISSSVSSVNFIHGSNNVVFDGTYFRYILIFKNLIGDANELNFRITNDGGSSFLTSNYVSTLLRVFSNTSSQGSSTNFHTDKIRLLQMNQASALSSGSSQGVIQLDSPNITQKPNILADCNGFDGSYNIRSMVGGTHTTAGTYNGFQLVLQSGNITGGIFSLYGVSN